MGQSKKTSLENTTVPQSSHSSAPHESEMLAFRKQDAFAETMTAIQDEMDPHIRIFSRFIHTAPIEIVSDILSRTVARPNALLTGGVFAFFGLLALYLTAQDTGFSLRGSELYLFFFTGWFIGILIDLVRIVFGATKTDA